MPTVTITMNASRDGVTNRDAEEGSVVGDKVTGPHPIPGTTALNPWVQILDLNAKPRLHGALASPDHGRVRPIEDRLPCDRGRLGHFHSVRVFRWLHRPLNPVPAGSSSSLTITASSTASKGTFTLTITGTAVPGTHITTVTLRVSKR